MDDRLQKKIELVEDEHAGEILDQRLAAFNKNEEARALFVLGGIRTADRIAASLGSEAMRATILFQEERLYEALGFENMVEFLQKSEFAPMTKNVFYARKELLEKEGDQVFDLLNDLGVSIRKRKLLGRGNIEIEGDTAIIHDGDEQIEIELTNRARILETLSALADANAEKSIKLDRQKEQLDKADGKIREAHAETDKIRAARISEFAADAHMTARVELGLAFNKFSDIVVNLSDTEKDQFRDSVLEDVQAWFNGLRDAYRTSGSHHPSPITHNLKGDSLDEKLENFLDQINLDTADNDGDLAAAL